MGRKYKYTFLQRKHMYDQKPHKKMLSITNREMQIKPTMRYHLTFWSEWPSSKSLQTINAGKSVEKKKKENPPTLLGGM